MEQVQSDADANKQSGKTQHVRKRKKQYYKRIRQQMEFYFGDSNLSKDRYLNKLIAINPCTYFSKNESFTYTLTYIPNYYFILSLLRTILIFPVFKIDVALDVFLNFNKIKEMTHGIEDIQKALDGSEILELSSDRQSVRRVTEMRKKDDIDEYMIYVVRKTSFIWSFKHGFS